MSAGSVPTSFCGVFVGHYCGEQVALVLAVSPQQTFGSFLRKGSVVTGKVFGTGVTLTEINCFDQSYRKEFALRFDGVSLVGAGQDGPLVMALDSEVPCSRFVGDAHPDESLKDFLLPVNPCNWVLACIRGQLWGAGYFDDSADIPGKQVLMFNLEGEEGNAWRLTKTYENGTEFSVVYSSERKRSVFEEETFGGTWRNESAGSFGTFEIRKCAVGNQTVVLCNVCSRLIEPGTLRWKIPAGGSWCQFCRPEKLSWFAPDLFEQDQHVVAACARDVAVKAFQAFPSRIFLGVFDETGHLETKTYAQVFQDVIQGPKVASPQVVVAGPTNYTSIVLTLACLLQDVVVISLENDKLAAQVAPEVPVLSFLDVQASPEKPIVPRRWEISTKPRNSSDTVCFLSTSGTSGIPKLARFSEDLCLPSEGVVTSPFVRADVVSFDPSFLPSLLQTMKFGGSRYLCSTDLKCLSVCRPTHLGA
jgi:hypothetical protein